MEKSTQNLGISHICFIQYDYSIITNYVSSVNCGYLWLIICFKICWAFPGIKGVSIDSSPYHSRFGQRVLCYIRVMTQYLSQSCISLMGSIKCLATQHHCHHELSEIICIFSNF